MASLVFVGGTPNIITFDLIDVQYVPLSDKELRARVGSLGFTDDSIGR